MTTTQHTIEQKLQAVFSPIHLEVIDESHMHNVPEGAESHFKVVLVSEAFVGQKLIARHRQVNQALKEELNEIHALALHTMTPEDWFNRGGTVTDSPPCLGGSKQT
ncbi:MAG: BolA/IbaG family iron-sulfur metabolism protein [Candidatus Thiodiazotropha sp. (ex Monitilora ramsayi)]|nr:BolA/IbaG family iron-sulfur metabolism protein [Candidatus Thiodiazotropha sp. (ex Monitilora ramsayi)]